MVEQQRNTLRVGSIIACALMAALPARAADAPLGGFIPFVGIGLTREFDTLDDEATFFIADRQDAWTGTPLGPTPATPYFDFALLDTGAATHILTNYAAAAGRFGIATSYSGNSDGFVGTNFQTIFGASGSIDLRINDPLGVFVAGLKDGTSNGTSLTMTTSAMRGQSSVAMLQSIDDNDWTLPNIIGLPMAAQHGIAIRNSEPVIYQHNFQGDVRTVRTPNVDLIARGSGDNEGILRQVELKLRPSAGFLQGPIYVQSGDIFSLDFHEDPASPTVVDSGGLFIEVDFSNGSKSLEDRELLFDTGADLTVLSRATAKKLGFDALLDEPDYVFEVEGAGGVTTGVPVIHIDELNLDTVGGSFTLQNVPVLVLDLPNPNDPANTVAGILGMHVFSGRDIVIDANPAAGGDGGGMPRLFISDPVATVHAWSTTAATGTWGTSGNWSVAGVPAEKWDATVANVSGSDQTAVVSANSTIFRTTVSGTTTADMTVKVNTGATLTVFGETLIKQGGRVELAGGKLDSQFVNIESGTLAGEGEVFVGAGPTFGQVRNLTGRVEPGDPIGELTIDGDYTQQAAATLVIDLGGTTPIVQYDHLQIDRYAFLHGTLQVNLSSFTPAANMMFTILTADEGVVGEFDNLVLPTGYTWDVAYNANDVVLTVLGVVAPLTGDFNSDGIVNAADYVVWRKTSGTAQQYLDWKQNFGRSPPGGSGSGAGSVPEPAGALLLLAASAMLIGSRCCVTRAARFAA